MEKKSWDVRKTIYWKLHTMTGQMPTLTLSLSDVLLGLPSVVGMILILGVESPHWDDTSLRPWAHVKGLQWIVNTSGILEIRRCSIQFQINMGLTTIIHWQLSNPRLKMGAVESTSKIVGQRSCCLSVKNKTPPHRSRSLLLWLQHALPGTISPSQTTGGLWRV